jgi:hypothetical protein
MMKFILRLLLVLLLFGVAPVLNAQDLKANSLKDAAMDKKFASVKGEFAIALPTKNDYTEDLTLDDQYFKGAGIFYGWRMREAVLSVMFINTTSQYLPSNEAGNEAFFRGFINGMLTPVKGKLLSSSRIKYGASEGVKFKYETDKFNGIGRMYIIGERIYYLNAMLAAEPDSEKIAEQIFETFKVVKQTDKPQPAPSKKL